MRKLARWSGVALAAGLAGCVLPPPLPPPPPPLVALPGPGKTQAVFQADDAGCRAAADATPPTGQTITVPIQGAAPVQATGEAQATAPAATQTIQVTPGMVYLRCMADHQDIVQPLAPVRPLYYGYYAAYPIYYGFGDTYPWLYGDYFGFGFFGGGFYGRGFYGGGFRDYGFRDYGFRGDGFRGGEGFRGGGFGGGRR